MDPNPLVCSENALLAERSFMSGQDKPSVENGYHLEWTEKIAANIQPSQGVHSKTASIQDTARTRCRKVYAHGHDFNINSISNNSDGETFISADDLRINLWNLEISDQCFNIIDMKPPNMEDLTEVITSAEFHPIHCNLLAYSSSRGFIRLVDMRRSALCDHSARIFQNGGSQGFRSFFTEIIASISDIKFSKDGRHILSRDYMTLKLWDMHMDSSPVATFKVHDHLHPKIRSHGTEGMLLSKHLGMEFNLKPLRDAAPRARRSSLSNLTRGLYRHGCCWQLLFSFL
ncbi:Serine/threonine protein phosphatase 2A 55 kDa regulatory subunit B beta isoform [Morella rubra]|uniref:Serine/threonine-protein phosphatase 2A 55 kDa regulatory subunit B n=1 Tax=Morella rubra TaxID=262757 RepID=A0A6A1UPA4_9ROSI|nr:Serine/threonine protein phosphatase 2A 55 kDa regulatory subunit B beta isoform [Morella rubra]